MFDLTEDQLELQKMLRRFAQNEVKPYVEEMDRAPKGEVNWDLIKKACKIGLFSGWLPRRYGGTLGGVNSIIAMEELSAVDAGFALLVSAPAMGIAAVAFSGDKNLADRFFPPIVEAEKTGIPELWAYCITEPDAGSDVEDQRGSRTARLTATAKRKGDRYIINGAKRFISAGNIAKWYAVFATLDKKRGVDAWTCFAVPAATPGLSIGTIEDKMGQRACPAVEVIFEDVEVPVENRIGKEGEGWAINRKSLSASRAAVGAIGYGTGRGAYEIALNYATERYQGGCQIIEHQITQVMLADMATEIEAARLLCYKAASTRPASLKLSSMAKVFGSEVGERVCSKAIQILGGYGYMRDYRVEEFYRNAKVTQIYEGLNQINRLAIAEGIMAEIGYEYKY